MALTEDMQKCILFANISKEELEPYMGSVTCKPFKKDQIVYQADVPPENLFIVKTGRIRFDMSADKSGESDRETSVYFASENQYFGEIELLSGQGYYSRALAVKDSDLIIIPNGVFQEIITEFPAVLKTASHVLAKNLRLANISMTNALLKGLEYRLVSLLLQLAKRFNDGEDHNSTILQLSQEELAQMLGASRQAINKHLKSYRDNGWIEFGYGKINIIDHDSFRDYCRKL